MNWSKIKTVFIIMLFLVNIFILRFIYTDVSENNSESKLQENIITLLENKRIYLPDINYISNTKMVNRITANFENVINNKKLEKSGFNMSKKSGYTAVFSKNSSKINIEEIEKYESMEKNTLEHIEDNKTKQKAMEFKDKYFKDISLFFLYTHSYKDMKVVRFVQTKYDSIILDGFLDIFLINNEVVYLVVRCYNLQLENKENITASMPKILYRLLREIEEQKGEKHETINIIDIKLGYHFFGPLKVKQGSLLPCYLFFDSKNNLYIVDAI